MLHEKQLGQNGQKPERCAISGRALLPEDIYFKVNGRWVGVKPREWRLLSDAEKRAMNTQWEADVPAAEVATSSVVSPVYEDMSLEDLKALATERGVDITGKRSKADIAQALRVADVAAKFAPAPVEEDGGLALDLSNVKGA